MSYRYVIYCNKRCRIWAKHYLTKKMAYMFLALPYITKMTLMSSTLQSKMALVSVGLALATDRPILISWSSSRLRSLNGWEFGLQLSLLIAQGKKKLKFWTLYFQTEAIFADTFPNLKTFLIYIQIVCKWRGQISQVLLLNKLIIWVKKAC